MATPNVLSYMNENGIKRKAVCERLNLTYQGLKNKVEGDSEFSASELKTLCLWWGIPCDYLLGIERK